MATSDPWPAPGPHSENMTTDKALARVIEKCHQALNTDNLDVIHAIRNPLDEPLLVLHAQGATFLRRPAATGTRKRTRKIRSTGKMSGPGGPV